MLTLTVWTNSASNEVKIVQLSDDPMDGNANDQITLIGGLPIYAGFSCVSENYAGPIPDGDAALWRWDGSKVVS